MRAIIVSMGIALATFAHACAGSCPDDVSPLTRDPGSARQWYLPAVGAPDAWGRSVGDGVVVAIVDNGFALDHPDLRERLWVNPAEIPDNDVDDDGDGHVDDVHGWDLLDDDDDVRLEAPAGLRVALRGHGTASAGIVAAQTDNGVGVAGACPGCRLMLLRGRDFVEAHTVLPVLPDAIRYAVRNGARVISISDGRFDVDVDDAVDGEIRAALAEAEAMGVVVVASAGNDGALGVRLPAAYPSVLSVASVDPSFAPSPTTSHGPEVDVSAPGDCVHTLDADGGTLDFSGTSAAAPIVAALAALILANEPSLDAREVRQRIRDGATPIDLSDSPELDGRMGVGVVSFSASVR